MSLYAAAQWLEHTKWSVALHESLWAYPIIESVHVLFLCLFLGMAIALDLRLIGAAFRTVPVSEMMDRLRPYTLAGFAVMVVTGTLLFYGVPVRTYSNIFFRLKLLFLLLSGINVWYFHFGTSKARTAGVVSLVLWAGVVVAGRMIAYDF
jgi:hypothetical protein